MYLKPVGTWYPDPAYGSTTVEFGFDICQEFVCAFIRQETLPGECSDLDSYACAPAVNPLWPGQFADWQNRGEYSYRHEVGKISKNGRLVQVTTRMYKSNDHHGFLTAEHFGQRVICSPERYACTRRGRYVWCIRSVAVSTTQPENSAWHGARGFRSVEELKILEDADIVRMNAWMWDWAHSFMFYG